MDIRADEAEAKAGLNGGTPRTIEGPLYVAGAPESDGFARLDDGSESAQAEVLFMQGTVYDQQGKPLPGAKVEVWHANLMGNYSLLRPEPVRLQPAPHHLRRCARALPVPQHHAQGLWLSSGRQHAAPA